jgi:CrcB protein
MRAFFLVGAGGALGSMARYWVWTLVAPRSAGFPWATMAVNLSGSLLVGFLAGVLTGRLDDTVRFSVFFGLLGGYTTFSTFSVDTVELLRVGEMVPATMNVTIAIVGGLLAAWAGIVLGESLV